MPISHAIAHHLRRDADSDAVLTLRPDELAPEGNSTVLLDKVKSSFLGRLSREHGSFDREGDTAPLPGELEAFLTKEHSFTQLTVALMEQLKQTIDEKKLELNAHVLFFIEKSFDHHRFYLFVANQSESLTIDSNLDVTPSYAIDTGPSLFGIKVDLAEWKEREHYAYLSLLPPRGNQTLVEVFNALTGFSNGLNKEEATLTFLEGIEAYSKHVPEENVNDYRTQVVDYCMEQDERDEPVDLQGLSSALDGINCDEFVRHMASHNPRGEQEVMMDRRSLRRYVKFAGREKDLAISFSSFQLNNRVQYDPERDTLSIHGIPKALRKQLLGHLEES